MSVPKGSPHAAEGGGDPTGRHQKAGRGSRASAPPSHRRRSYKPAEQRREQILDCALQAFAERGYHATTIADVCALAGIGRGTLYQYFRDKRELLVALADRIADRVTSVFTGRDLITIPDFKPDEHLVAEFVQGRLLSILSAVFEDAATVRLVLKAGRGADGVVDGILRRVDEAVLDRMEAELRAAKEAGIIRDLDERVAARFFLGGIEKLALMYLDEDRPVDLEAVAREAALLEVSGMFARK